MEKISGPLLDRIDLHIEVPAAEYRELSSRVAGETSQQVRERVVAAGEIQMERLVGRNGLKTDTILLYCFTFALMSLARIRLVWIILASLFCV